MDTSLLVRLELVSYLKIDTGRHVQLEKHDTS